MMPKREHDWERVERRFFFKANIRGFDFFLIASWSNSQDNMLTEVFSSIIETVIGSQSDPEKLSIALLL